MKGAPYFPLYPSDLLGGTFAMSAAELGAYIRLLCYQWQGGSLPNDPERLAQLGGHAFASAVASKFDKGPDGMLRNARLEAEREKVTKKSAKASESAASRWKDKPAKDANAYANAYANGYATEMPCQMSDVRGHSTEDKGQTSEVKGGPGENAPRKRVRPPFVSVPDVLPASIECKEVRELLGQWIRQRGQGQSRVTEEALRLAIKKLDGYGAEGAIESLTYSVIGGHDGIFAPKNTPKPTGPVSYPPQFLALVAVWPPEFVGTPDPAYAAWVEACKAIAPDEIVNRAKRYTETNAAMFAGKGCNLSRWLVEGGWKIAPPQDNRPLLASGERAF